MHVYPDRRGFTLAELLIVIAVIAVLVAIAIPLFLAQRDQAEQGVCAANRAMVERQLKYEQMTNGIKRTSALLSIMNAADIHCPTGGTFVLSQGKDPYDLSVRCSHHGGDSTNTIPNAVMDDFTELLEEMLETQNWATNDRVRQSLYEKNGNGWPTLTVGAETYYIQPYYEQTNGSIYIYANKVSDQATKYWYADFIYDSDSRTWYQAPAKVPGSTVNPAIMMVRKDWEDVQKELEEKAWTELEQYAEGNFNL